MPTQFAPNVYVSDVARSLRFLTEALGFKETGRMAPEGGAPVWASLERDGQRIMIEKQHQAGKLAATVDFYLSVDALEPEISRLRGARVELTGPEDKPYGMREVAFRDPDGYSWMVGERIKQA